MTKQLNKLQIRAEILNAIKTLDSGDKHTQEFLDSVINSLKEIEDKNTVLDILIKEIIASKNDDRFLILSFLIENLIPKEMLEQELWKLLEQPQMTDSAKANIINILKDLGNQINYEKYTEYFENPDSIIDADTERMLKSAIYNPEAQIDFLDFIEALPDTDKSMLIDSLCEDYSGNELANLFLPVVYANPDSVLCKDAIKRLGASKSPLALRPLNFIINYTKDNEILSLAKKSLSELKISGSRDDITDKFLAEVYAESKIDNVYISMPDGHGNVGIIVSRKRINKDSVQMFAVVFNDTAGIIDCFGFNDITTIEFERIVSRFYSNQEKICITPSVAKLLLTNAEEKALETAGRISYEYICWRNLLCDAVNTEETLKEILSKKLENVDVSVSDIKMLYETTSIFDKWFFHRSGNKAFDEFINDFVVNNSNNFNFKYLEDKISAEFDKIWTDEELARIDFRLLLCAYLLNLNGLKKYANVLYSIISNSETKQELCLNIIKLSIYEFLLREKEKYQNTTISTNIFSRRNQENQALIEKTILNSIIKEVETNWGI